jgi:guanine nucleotide-exchange factor
VQNCLESVNYAFTFNFRFLDLIRAYICYILLRASVSSALPVFQLAVNVYMILLQRFRETLKVELGIFFSLLLLRSLDGSETSLNHRSAVLKYVHTLSRSLK